MARDPFFASMARDVLNYMLRDMTHPDGGFYSAEARTSTSAAHCDTDGDATNMLRN